MYCLCRYQRYRALIDGNGELAAQTVIQTMHQIGYYSVYIGEEAIGTAITFETGIPSASMAWGLYPPSGNGGCRKR
ncbi:hypothetical protein [Parapedobacter sp. 2B3]|uniref:hypothetical protein n=1 Tax=Parapedobacter sp. 2B3 TaxID=3342381 RepID=UPI0035B654A4